MNTAEKQKYGDTFTFLNRVIEREEPKKNQDYGNHIKTATGLLEEIAEGLDYVSLLSNGAQITWDPGRFERAKEVLKLYGYDITTLSGDRLESMAQDFRDKIGIFMQLETDPDIVYKSVLKKQRLLNVCEKVMELCNGHPKPLD